jgi:N-acylneuraminate cytidylyltransferase
VPGKNTRLLAGHPLIAYTIVAAIESGIFQRVVVSTDTSAIAKVAERYGADVPFIRPAELAGPISPDVAWVRHALVELRSAAGMPDCFSILRPTSPFRRADTIRRAWDLFRRDGEAESLRAVQPCREHPAKMWVIEGSRMRPVMSNPDAQGTPWHSTPYQALPPVFVQNASLEIARSSVVLDHGTIAGESILPFLTEGLEGFDINAPDDWLLAELHVREQPDLLPQVSHK